MQTVNLKIELTPELVEAIPTEELLGELKRRGESDPFLRFLRGATEIQRIADYKAGKGAKPEPKERKEYMTVADVAEMLKISRAKIYDMIEGGTLEHIKVDGWAVRIERGAVDKIISHSAGKRRGV